MRTDFRPAKPSVTIRALAKAALPLVLRVKHVARVTIPEDDLARARSLTNASVVICPNHPTNTEPAIIFWLAQRAGQEFRFVACRESFNYFGGVWGWLIQRLGAYSIVRGGLDRASFQATRQSVAEPGSKVVIFPEGEVYSQNDSLLPFQSGVVQLAFWGLEDARKANATADVMILPVAVRYHYLADMTGKIHAALGHLERATGLGKLDEDSYARLRRVGTAVIERLERAYEVTPEAGDDLNARMLALKTKLLHKACTAIGVEPPRAPLPEQMRYLINAVHTVTSEDAAPDTNYDTRLWIESRDRIRLVLNDLDRLANWIAVYDGYVAASPTQERMIHTLRRLEVEVFGRSYIRGPQECTVRVGEPISLSEYAGRYATDRKAVVGEVTVRLEWSVQAMLDEMSQSAGER